VLEEGGRPGEAVEQRGILRELPDAREIERSVALIAGVGAAVFLVPALWRLPVVDAAQEVPGARAEAVLLSDPFNDDEGCRGGRKMVRQDAVMLVVAAEPVPCPRESLAEPGAFVRRKLVGDQSERLADIEAGKGGRRQAVLEWIGFVERSIAMLQRAPERHGGARPGERFRLAAQRIFMLAAIEVRKCVSRLLKARAGKVREFPRPEGAVEAAVGERGRLAVAG